MKTTAKGVHYFHHTISNGVLAVAYCYTPHARRGTSELEKVTCKRCLKQLSKSQETSRPPEEKEECNSPRSNRAVTHAKKGK